MADDLIANFVGITGADEDAAISILEAANFDLQGAIELFYAAEAAGGVRAGAGGSGRGGGGGGAGGGAAGGGDLGPHQFEEEEVRAPLPTKVERLFGDHSHDPRSQNMHLRHLQNLHGQQNASHIDVFRDFRAETAQAQQAALGSAAGGAAEGAAGEGAGGAGGAGLSGLFKLPADLVFNGTLDMAKHRAAEEGKWLLFNVQSATEFASHRLNRDTWSHEALKEVLKGMFVFFQTYENTPDGTALIKSYRLNRQPAQTSPLPAILVVDPVTGAVLWQRAGWMDAEKLMEELVPFMDHGPLDAGAASIAQQTMKRKVASAAAGTAAAAGPSRPGGGGAPMSEDEELAMAIAMSMERGGGAGGAGAGGSGEEDEGAGGLDDLDEAEVWEQIRAAEQQQAEASARKTPEEVAAEARARLPAEPAEGDPGSLRVALRLPDGRRLMRRFAKGDTVQALVDLCVAELPEAAAGKTPVLTFAQPGAQPLSDPAQSLEAAGVAGAMLNVKLAD